MNSLLANLHGCPAVSCSALTTVVGMVRIAASAIGVFAQRVRLTAAKARTLTQQRHRSTCDASWPPPMRMWSKIGEMSAEFTGRSVLYVFNTCTNGKSIFVHC